MDPGVIFYIVRRKGTMDVVENTDLPNLMHRGKVRDSYSLDEKLFLMIATDRISAYDVW